MNNNIYKSLLTILVYVFLSGCKYTYVYVTVNPVRDSIITIVKESKQLSSDDYGLFPSLLHNDSTLLNYYPSFELMPGYTVDPNNPFNMIRIK